MGEVIFYVPRKKRRIAVVHSKKELNAVIAERMQKDSDLLREGQKKLKNGDNRNTFISKNTDVSPKRAVYTEIYSVLDNNSPVQIGFNDENSSKVDVEYVKRKIEEAYKQGYDECEEINKLKVKSELVDVYNNMRRIDEVIQELLHQYNIEEKKFEENTIAIACVIAESIIDIEINKDNSIIIEQVRKVLQQMNDSVVFSLYINPDDMELLEKAKSSLILENRSFAHTEVIGDAKITRGSCRLETAVGNIDATIKTQLENIKTELYSV